MRSFFLAMGITLSMFFASCGSADNNYTASTESPATKEPVYDPTVLLTEAKSHFSLKEYEPAKLKLELLLEKCPNSKEAKEGLLLFTEYEEEFLWEIAKTSTDESASETYLTSYPKGKYVTKAKIKIAELKKIRIQRHLEYAENTNTSTALEDFLSNYPDHPKAEEIRNKIIRLRVAEIMNDPSTGVMPDASHTGNYSSTNSVIKIKNDTGCELTVMYSGEDAKMVTIPVSETRSVTLSSGSYRVAASACGSNYAATQLFSGAYNSTFYISTSTYRF